MKKRTMSAWVCGVVCAVLYAAAAPVWAQDTPPDTSAAGSGTEDDPWILDVDDLVSEGYAVVVTDEGPTTMGEARLDTIEVSAPRLRVSELVRRVGEAMEEAGRAIGPHSFTQLQKIEVWEHRDDPAKVRRTEVVDAHRINVDADGEERTTRLYQQERKWRGGKLEKTETKDELERRWQDEVVQQTMAMPFDLLTANRYRYTIKERNLIGDHLVFRIGFKPKSKFEAGLSGDVWIDYNDFVIRRMEGAMVGPMPAPLFLKGVPNFVLTLHKEQGRWVADALRATVELNGSLPKIPDEVEIQVSLTDYTFGTEVK